MFSAEALDAVLTHALKCPSFLESYGHLLSVEHFTTRTLPHSGEREITARLIIEAWRLRRECLGPVFRTVIDNYARTNRFLEPQRKPLLNYAKYIATSPANAPDTVGESLKDTLSQQIIHAMVENLVQTHQSSNLTMDQVEQAVVTARQGVAKLNLKAPLFDEAIEDRIFARSIAAASMRYWSGIPPLDDLLRYPLDKGTFNAILAISKGGKSTSLGQMALGSVVQGANSLYLSLEDPKNVCEGRLDAAICSIPTNELENYPDKVRAYVRNFWNLVKGRLKVHDGTRETWTPSMVRDWIRREKQAGFFPDVVYVDYLSLLKLAHRRNEYRIELTEIAEALRQIGAEENVIMWTAFQGNLQLETIHAKELDIGSAAEAKGLVRVCNVMVGLGRGDYEVPKEEYMRGIRGYYLQIIAAKNHPSRVGTNVVANLACGKVWDYDLTRHYASLAVNQEVQAEDAEKKAGKGGSKQKRLAS